MYTFCHLMCCLVLLPIFFSSSEPVSGTQSLVPFTNSVTEADKLKLKVEITSSAVCPGNKVIKPSNFNFEVGCTINLTCANSLCVHSTEDISIIAASDSIENPLILKTLEKSNCSITVQLMNLTMNDFSQVFQCYWKGQKLDARTVSYGYKPDQPQNLTITYQPHKYIMLEFDVGKTSKDLNNETTTNWTVNYAWQFSEPNETCAPVKALSSDYHLSCRIKLSGYDKETENYLDIGSIINNISFVVTAHNIFGSRNNSIEGYLPCLVKPYQLKPEMKVIERGATWLILQVPLPVDIDLKIAKKIKTCGSSSQLRYVYTVYSLSEEVQSMYINETQRFMQTYGFFRNIKADEEVMQNSSATSILFSEEEVWNRRKLINISITGLSPFTHYNISVRPYGKYQGEETFIAINQTYTGESSEYYQVRDHN